MSADSSRLDAVMERVMPILVLPLHLTAYAGWAWWIGVHTLTGGLP